MNNTSHFLNQLGAELKRAGVGTHNLYVIELSKDILGSPAFKRRYPRVGTSKAVLYVGMTGHSPEHRFAQHKAGTKASRWVREFGKQLLFPFFVQINPMPYDCAKKNEVLLAQALREDGFAVIQN